MSNVYTFKVIKHGQVILRKQISNGTRKGMAATVLQAGPDVTYVFQSQDGASPIKKIITKKVGKDLHLTTEDGDINAPDIIIENYAEFEQNTAFATTLRSGGLSFFDTQSNGIFTSSLFGAESGITSLVASGAETTSFLSPLVLAGAGAVALIAAKSSSKSDTAAVPDANATALAKITSYGTTGTTATPTVNDYTEAGFKDVTSGNVSAINNAIASVKADSNAKVSDVVTAYLKILAEANGTNADATPNADPLLSDYQALGVQPLNTLTDAQKPNYLSLLNDIVKNRLVADIITVAKLSALSAMAEKIILIAAGNTGTTATTLTAADFQTMGLAVTIPNSMLMNAMEASANDGSSINSLAAIKAIDASYSKILAQADGIKANTSTAAKLTVADLTSLGLLSHYDATGTTNTGGAINGKAIGTGAQNASALNLLNDVMDGKTSTLVDTTAEINQLSILVDKVMDIASGATAASALTATDLSSLGLTGVTANNLQKIANQISATHSADGSAVDSLAELQTLVAKAVIQTYAEDQSVTSPAPTLQDYKDSGLTLATSPSVTWTENLKTGVNSVLATKHTYALVPDIALSFQAVLDEASNGASNTHADPTAAQYTMLLTTSHVLQGGTLGATTLASDNALSLMNDVVAHKSQLGVDTVSELEAYATAIDHIMNTAAAISTTNPVTLAELSTLGLNNTASANQATFNTNLRATLDSGADVHTWAQLQALINSSIS